MTTTDKPRRMVRGYLGDTIHVKAHGNGVFHCRTSVDGLLLAVGRDAPRAVATRLREDGKPDAAKFRVQFIDVHAKRPDVVTTVDEALSAGGTPTPAY